MTAPTRLLTLLAALAATAAVQAAVPVTPGMKTFGHSVKNGPLPAATELTTFEHNCSAPPCTVTQVRCVMTA